ncbi:unnamed protein product [Gongylonema pulchrum]|uniref:Kinesin motor domain-containing protein n=1 Tax=Gongylonema pulchrum TaxID=637853 RepID=A0A3P7Q5G3_9BILA|nr:unnamed protein product [Gongylonema pulchrum]
MCLVDLGLGERTSKGDVHAMTMPVITNLLVALFQGQRYLPSRQSPLCMLLRESLGSVHVKASLLFASLSDRISETENILQMMSKIQRAAKPRKTHRVSDSFKIARSEANTMKYVKISKFTPAALSKRFLSRAQFFATDICKVGSDSSSSDTARRRLAAASSEGNSSSEQSCAETVIFLGPSIREGKEKEDRWREGQGKEARD